MNRQYIKPRILDSVEINVKESMLWGGLNGSTTDDNWAKQRTHFDDWDEEEDDYWGNDSWSDDDSPGSQGY